MALIFHQNMRVYGGHSAFRDGWYTPAFITIGGLAPGGQSYWVAGFTEVMNASDSLQDNLGLHARLIDAALTHLFIIQVGITAVGAQREFIGIAYAPGNLNVQHVGQVLWNSQDRRWAGYESNPGRLIDQTMWLPPAPLGADARGLAYIAALDNNGNSYAFGFMHNMFQIGNPNAAYSSLGVMCSRMISAMHDPTYTLARTNFYIGGDFNISPRDRSRRGGKTLYPKAHRTGGTYTNTTYWNPYDYWVVSDITRTDAHVSIFTQTRVPFCSDHAGISLQLSP